MPNALFDRLIIEVDTALKTLLPPARRLSQRPFSNHTFPETQLTIKQRQHIAGLMRVNHAGEVCAQALYQGQALTAQLTHIKEQMNQAALEETDHLAWCEQRLRELGSKPSLLNPFWYAGSLLIGAMAGLAGDSISLGFVAETERQVSAHLQKHLAQIPEADQKTKAILRQMHDDESSHAVEAKQAGAVELPSIIQAIMSAVSRLMTKTSYYF